MTGDLPPLLEGDQDDPLVDLLLGLRATTGRFEDLVLAHLGPPGDGPAPEDPVVDALLGLVSLCRTLRHLGEALDGAPAPAPAEALPTADFFR